MPPMQRARRQLFSLDYAALHSIVSTDAHDDRYWS